MESRSLEWSLQMKSIYPTFPRSEIHFVAFVLTCLCNDTAPRRRCTCTRKRCRRWSTRSPRPRLTNSSHGLPRRLPTATSARAFFGVSPDKGCGARSAVSSATRSARTCWMRIACNVSNLFYIYFFNWSCAIFHVCWILTHSVTKCRHFYMLI